MTHHFKRLSVVESKWIIRQKLIAISHPGEYPFELAAAALYLRLPPSRLRIHLAEGTMNGKELPICYKATRHFYFLRKDLDTFMGVSTPTLATADRPVTQIVQFLDGLPLTNRQRGLLLGVSAETFRRLKGNRQSSSRIARFSDCKELMARWPDIGEQVLARWAAGDDLLQVVREEADFHSFGR